MQTFLTHYSTAKSLHALDRTRANKQRPEAIHILESLLGIREGYKHHPVMKMWRGHEPWLASYAMMSCHIYTMRRIRYGEPHPEKFDYLGKVVSLIDEYDLTRKLGEHSYDWARQGKRRKIRPGCPRPPWREDNDFLTSHRSNLIRKDPSRYIELFGEGTPRLAPYLWPEVDPDDPGEYILRISMADRERLRKGERFMPEGLGYDETDGIVL